MRPPKPLRLPYSTPKYREEDQPAWLLKNSPSQCSLCGKGGKKCIYEQFTWVKPTHWLGMNLMTLSLVAPSINWANQIIHYKSQWQQPNGLLHNAKAYSVPRRIGRHTNLADSCARNLLQTISVGICEEFGSAWCAVSIQLVKTNYILSFWSTYSLNSSYCRPTVSTHGEHILIKMDLILTLPNLRNETDRDVSAKTCNFFFHLFWDPSWKNFLNLPALTFPFLQSWAQEFLFVSPST